MAALAKGTRWPSIFMVTVHTFGAKSMCSRSIGGPSSRLSPIMSPVRAAVRIIRSSHRSADRFRRRPRLSEVFWWFFNNWPWDLRKLL